ncbi:LysR family transcriptional regulator [Cupriavidus basilensis]|uniref:LysR family transcriptional regulator n=1 Tax=Cupriavidus basilensis TaxID=68895 RepID=A0ABT6ANK3_9BURK|nr:LysR family transcriptional regulator [Cupriavidus basilensis]MDF3834199.1 LysR family transcriptional regulator [Cupriavidus basilensis]
MDIERAMRRVRLHDLQTLVAVVQAGGMRKASQAMHLSQSAVSRVIGELEDTLGLRLLERGPKGIEPTPFGEALVRRSKAVFDEMQGALRELDHLADPSGGEVRLGCMETLHAGLVSATMEAVLRKHPRMRFVLESGQSPDLINHFLMERMVSFVVARPYKLPLPPGIDGEPLFHDHMRVVVGHAGPFAKRRRIELDELVDAHWILSRNEVMPETPLPEALAARGLAMPQRVIHSGSLMARYSLLDTGRFVTMVPHSLLPFGRHREMFKVLPIALPPWRTPTMILTLRGRTLGPAAQLFLSVLRELAQPLCLPPRSQ